MGSTALLQTYNFIVWATFLVIRRISYFANMYIIVVYPSFYQYPSTKFILSPKAVGRTKRVFLILKVQ